jgi:hypothetical protein
MLEILVKIALFVLLPLVALVALVVTFVWAMHSPYAGGFAFLMVAGVTLFGGAFLTSWLNGY